ncbi:hypothetical protein AB0903_07050 [Streptomyces sp. NPDC048389]|uniref:hypothetical protein n=1 Tax=Streptomyces sp. NPDC048389 TaxID=3154622 RepID=UPI003452F036
MALTYASGMALTYASGLALPATDARDHAAFLRLPRFLDTLEQPCRRPALELDLRGPGIRVPHAVRPSSAGPAGTTKEERAAGVLMPAAIRRCVRPVRLP